MFTEMLDLKTPGYHDFLTRVRVSVLQEEMEEAERARQRNGGTYQIKIIYLWMKIVRQLKIQRLKIIQIVALVATSLVLVGRVKI